MIRAYDSPLIRFQRGDSNFTFLPTGDTYEWLYASDMLNRFHGNVKDGSVNNIYLRLYDTDGSIREVWPLVGAAGGQLSAGENHLLFETNRTTSEGAISCRVRFLPAAEGLWFWQAELDGEGQDVDLLYLQDTGVAERGALLANELYVSQYLGHRVFETENGYVVSSRQNMPMSGRNPCMEQGALKGCVTAYATDATQLFGSAAREGFTAALLNKPLPSVNYQFECACIALQTQRMKLDQPRELVFYGLYIPNLSGPVTQCADKAYLLKAYTALTPDTPISQSLFTLGEDWGSAYACRDFTVEEIEALYPHRLLEEWQDGQLLSFFTPSHDHVVTRRKELLCERPHGTISTTASGLQETDEGLMSTTQMMYGVFNSQTVVGNTSFHKLFSTPRGLLNVLKNSGQRIYLQIDGTYRLLTVPALFVMGLNYAKWYYPLPNADTFVVTSYTAAHDPAVVLEAESLSGKPYACVVTQQLVMGEHERTNHIQTEQTDPSTMVISLPPEARANHPYPELHYILAASPQPLAWGGDNVFFKDGKSNDPTFLSITFPASAQFNIRITGRLQENTAPDTLAPIKNFEQEQTESHNYFRDLNRDFRLEWDNGTDKLPSKLNSLAFWYSHNAMVHFSAPHGLEQPGGAAWGTRDVCQGPFELLLATQRYPLLKDILLRIFSHQQESPAQWPQWFMYDRYPYQAGECHGDVIFWPLKCLADYLRATGDQDVLDTPLPYLDSTRKDSLLTHACRAVDVIMSRMDARTGIINYEGGDWDDTLQPADDSLRDNLFSAWTNALAYQTLTSLSDLLAGRHTEISERLRGMARQIHEGFHRYFVIDGVIAGFLKLDGQQYVPMLHPADTRSGVQYRLIPMTRSIIAGLVDENQARQNIETIRKHLLFPDGVRLMNRPVRYDGGVSVVFLRAEQAANVGREIGLHYIHAHIRYIEALAVLGMADEAWDALERILPILLHEKIPNAARRQANAYFSSSDGDFIDRYAFQAHFDALKTGEVTVKAGWRIYSSGPGILLHTVIAHLLGIRFTHNRLELDPVLPRAYDGLRFHYNCFGKPFTFVYHYHTEPLRVLVNGTPLPGEPLPNRYRAGGLSIDKAALPDGGVIDLYCHGV